MLQKGAKKMPTSILVWTSCGEHEPMPHRYGDGSSCRNCGTVVVSDTPGMADLDYAYSNGVIDTDTYWESVEILYLEDSAARIAQARRDS